MIRSQTRTIALFLLSRNIAAKWRIFAVVRQVNTASELRDLINQDNTVVFVIIGDTDNARSVRDLADSESGSVESFTRVVAQASDPSLIDDPALDPALRSGAPSANSTNLA